MQPGHKFTFGIGTPKSLPESPIRAVLGKITPAGKAFTEILAAYEPEISVFLQDPNNREALAKDPLQALSNVLPGDVLKTLGQPVPIPPQLQEKLQKLPFRPGTKVQSPALDLFSRAWAHVSVSAANFASFNADMNGTLRQIDPAATTPVVNEVIAAFDTARGIHQLDTGVSPGFFSGQIHTTLNEAQATLLGWPR